MPDNLKITVSGADTFRAPMASEWGMSDVEAACIVRQGHSPSMAMTMLGVGVFQLFTPKKGKDLPRKFVLAVTPERVVAYDASAHGRGNNSSDDTFHVTVKPDEIASWPRSDVSMRPAKKGIALNAYLVIGGNEIPCSVPSGHAEDAFAALQATLGGAPAPAAG